MNKHLSKSQFIRASQCHKSLWLYKHKPELMPPADQETQRIFDMGTEVGVLACDLFPGGKKIVYDREKFDRMIEETALHIENGVETIYEATFRFDNIIVMADILHKGQTGWEIYEVKSSTRDKPVHVDDIAIQYYVLTGSGLNISSVSLVHINNQYIRSGALDIKQLFTIVDLTDKVLENQDDVKSEIAAIKSMVKGDCPDVDIGDHCTDPYDCDFIDHCWLHIPENSIFDLSERGIDKFAYYKKGIIQFSDLNLKELNSKQGMQVEAELTGKDFINDEGIKKFLDTLYYPLCFLDFETFQAAIPPFDGLRPYMQIPFQYSLHYMEKENSDLKHYEFLAEPGKDPREDLIKNLTGHISDNACILAYNMQFEKNVLKMLADQFPQYKKKTMKIHDNMIDLMTPFRRRDYYTKEMKGSYSLKYVLPALVPDLTYKGMNVSDGQEAMSVYLSLPSIKNKDEAEQIKTDLLEYCELDTYALVKLLERLRESI